MVKKVQKCCGEEKDRHGKRPGIKKTSQRDQDLPLCLTFQLPKREDLIGPVSHSEARVRLSHTCGLAALEAGVQPAVATWQSHTAQHTVCEQPPRNNCGCGRQVTEHDRLFPSITYKM